MKNRLLTFLCLMSVLSIFVACQKDGSLTPADAQELNRPTLSKDIVYSLNETEKAQFSPQELKELEHLLLATEDDLQLRDGHIIEVPAGSEDALAAAIEQAEEGGTILLKSGDHKESSTVTISKRITLLGEAGAVLKNNTQSLEILGMVEPALHILDVAGVTVRGISIEAEDRVGGTGILIENSDRTIVRRNSIIGHEAGVMIVKSNRAIVVGNTIETSLNWASSPDALGFGVVAVSGNNARILDNDVSASLFGVWACDKAGWYIGNTTHNGFIGLILCKVPDNAYPLPSGAIAGSEQPGNQWLAIHNSSYENANVGYLVIDGANSNFLSSNAARDNGSYDIELVGDSERFGIFTPTSANNLVFTSSGITIKDCGIDNRARGGEMVDNTVDPCF